MSTGYKAVLEERKDTVQGNEKEVFIQTISVSINTLHEN